MREILFRGKRRDNGEWVEGLFVKDLEAWGRPDVHSYIVNHKYPSGCFGRDIFLEVDPSTVGEYTGLKDRNGMRIFDGDIVRHYHRSDDSEAYVVGLVFWNKKRCCFMRTGGSDGDVFIGDHCVYEVIGNVYDSPEVLA